MGERIRRVTPPPSVTYSSSTLSFCAGVSLRMLQWWDEQELIEPRHEAHKRLYSRQLALVVMVVSELKRKGVTLHDIRKALPGIKKAIVTRYDKVPDLILALDAAGKVTASIVPAAVLTLLVEASSAMWVIHVGDLANRLPHFPISERREPAA